MTPTEWRAADMTAVAGWLATLPSWGAELVGLESSADNRGDWHLSFLGTRPAVLWLARVAVGCPPTPAEAWVVEIPARPWGSRWEVTVRWHLWRPVGGRDWAVWVRATVPVTGPTVWTDALRAAAAPAETAPEPAAPDGQGELFAELTG
jgi:hypothetical protein